MSRPRFVEGMRAARFRHMGNAFNAIAEKNAAAFV
jgi:hypothetical protein